LPLVLPDSVITPKSKTDASMNDLLIDGDLEVAAGSVHFQHAVLEVPFRSSDFKTSW